MDEQMQNEITLKIERAKLLGYLRGTKVSVEIRQYTIPILIALFLAQAVVLAATDNYWLSTMIVGAIWWAYDFYKKERNYLKALNNAIATLSAPYNEEQEFAALEELNKF